MQVPELGINEEKKRFELQIEDHVAVLYFEVYESQVWMLTHTLVPDPLKGQGFGSKLVDLVLGYCDKNSIRVIPDCLFVRSYIKRYPEWKRILFEQE